MNKKHVSSIFFVIFAGLVLILAGHNFVRYYIAGDYPVHVFTYCDTTLHTCFVADPDIADPTFQSAPYSKVEMTAAHAPKCLDEHTCSDFTCEGVMGYCQVTYCAEDTKEEGESCSLKNK